MPELPEVKTVANTLRNNLLNKTVTKINIIYPKIIEPDSLNMNLLIGHTLIDINTKGKYLIFNFDDLTLISHLRMEGKYFIKNINDPLVKHEHIIIEFDNISLRYHDTRKFGRMLLIKTKDLSNAKCLNKLGYEPFDQNMSAEYLLSKFTNKSLPMKSLLLDQTIINGLGNIYADEVLFASNINPLTKGKDITKNDANNIIESSKEILNNAIKNGGTTIRSYTSSLGVIGHYQDYLKVHKRENEECLVCHSKIKKIKVGGRSTYYCPTCQK